MIQLIVRLSELLTIQSTIGSMARWYYSLELIVKLTPDIDDNRTILIKKLKDIPQLVTIPLNLNKLQS